jgi:hypothetical protein
MKQLVFISAGINTFRAYQLLICSPNEIIAADKMLPFAINTTRHWNKMCIYMSAQLRFYQEQLIGEEKAIFADFEQQNIKDSLHGKKKVAQRRLAVSVDLAGQTLGALNRF